MMRRSVPALKFGLRSASNRLLAKQAFTSTSLGASRGRGHVFLNRFSTSSVVRNEDSFDIKVNGDKVPLGKVKQEKLLLQFTCKKCNERSSHVISKQAYTGGTILVECPGCHNRHLIADHLKIFSDTRINIEDILKAKGESVSTDNNDIVFEELPKSIQEKLHSGLKAE